MKKFGVTCVFTPQAAQAGGRSLASSSMQSRDCSCPQKSFYQHQFSGSNNVTTQLGVLEGPTKNHFLEDPKLYSLYFLMKIAGFRPSLTAQDFVDQGNVESVSLPSIIAFCSFSSNSVPWQRKKVHKVIGFRCLFLWRSSVIRSSSSQKRPWLTIVYIGSIKEGIGGVAKQLRP